MILICLFPLCFSIMDSLCQTSQGSKKDIQYDYKQSLKESCILYVTYSLCSEPHHNKLSQETQMISLFHFACTQVQSYCLLLGKVVLSISSHYRKYKNIPEQHKHLSGSILIFAHIFQNSFSSELC